MKENCTKCINLVHCRTQIVYPTLCKSGGLLVVGEAPGRDEDLIGEGFVGIAGKTLDRLLVAHNIQRSNYSRANICRCRPPNNRKPTVDEIEACLPFLAKLITDLKPKVILTIGATPTALFCGAGALYDKIIQQQFEAKYYINLANPQLSKVLKHVEYIVPSPHTSPLAFNRNSPSGEKWGAVTTKQVAIATMLLK